MKLSHVLTACNDKYSRFIPLFIHYWKKFYPDVKPVIIYVGKLSNEYEKYRQYITEYEGPIGLPTAYVAQTVRLLWPAILNETDGVLITDIDMIPANSTYFTKNINNLDNNMFINYRQGDGGGLDCKQIYMCYNIAPSKIWGDIFDIRSIEDINKFLITNINPVYDSIHGGNGWCTDQELFYLYFFKWAFNNVNYIFLNDKNTLFMRMEPNCLDYNKNTIKQLLKTQIFSDCHFFSNRCPWTADDIIELLDQ